MKPQMKLNLCVKKLEQEVKYINPNKQIRFNQEQTHHFLVQTLNKEVKQLKRNEKKKLKTICKQVILTSISLLTLATPALAATPGTDMIMPSDIAKIGMYLIGLGAVGSTFLAIILLQLANGFRLFRKGNEATSWTIDIIKGYVQIILSPVIIMIIAFTAYLLFNGFQFFVKPF